MKGTSKVTTGRSGAGSISRFGGSLGSLARAGSDGVETTGVTSPVAADV